MLLLGGNMDADNTDLRQRHPRRRHALIATFALIGCIVVVFSWMWLRLFVCWDDPFWGASILCHLEFVAIALLLVPLIMMLRLIRPHLPSVRLREELRSVASVATVAIAAAADTEAGAEPWTTMVKDHVRTRAREHLDTVPSEHRHLVWIVPVLLGALFLLALFLWNVRFNLFWTY